METQSVEMMELQLCRHILLTKWDDCEIFDEYDNLRKKFHFIVAVRTRRLNLLHIFKNYEMKVDV